MDDAIPVQIVDEPVVLIVIWVIVLAIGVAVAASRYGKNGALWLLLSLVLSPLMALLLLMMETRTYAGRAPVIASSGETKDTPPALSPGMTSCPKCDNPVPRKSSHCPTCGLYLGS